MTPLKSDDNNGPRPTGRGRVEVPALPNRSTFMLALPPRRVPLSLVIKVLFGGVRGQLGWGIALVGVLVSWIFVLNSEFMTPYYFNGQVLSAAGKVTRIEKTSFSEGGNRRRSSEHPIYAIHYSYQADGGEPRTGVSYKATSYGSGPPKVGPEVIVEYPAGRPDISRIEGLRRKPFAWFLRFLAIVPVAGFGLALYGFFSGLGDWALLSRGHPTTARLLNKRRTGSSVNKQSVWAMTFEYTTIDGATYETVVKTHLNENLEDDAEERLIYNPGRPGQAVLVDSLPGEPQIDSSGNFIPVSGLAATVTLVLPILATGLAVVCVMLQMRSP